MLIFDGAEIGSYYVIAVHSVLFALWLVGAVSLGLYVEHVANKPQPPPDADAWRREATR